MPLRLSRSSTGSHPSAGTVADASVDAWIAHAVRQAADGLRLWHEQRRQGGGTRRRRSGTSNGGKEEEHAAAAAWTYGSYDEHVAPRRLFASAAAGSTHQMP
ncbi:hypothetical protein ACP70R_008521 [Stipagrostis hirtigluma subsp. patula]